MTRMRKKLERYRTANRKTSARPRKARMTRGCVGVLCAKTTTDRLNCPTMMYISLRLSYLHLKVHLICQCQCQWNCLRLEPCPVTALSALPLLFLSHLPTFLAFHHPTDHPLAPLHLPTLHIALRRHTLAMVETSRWQMSMSAVRLQPRLRLIARKCTRMVLLANLCHGTRLPQ